MEMKPGIPDVRFHLLPLKMRHTEANIKLMVKSLMKFNKTGLLPLVLTTAMLTFVCCDKIIAQNKSQMVRLAKIVIDSAQLESYKGMLKEEIETSVRVEPGVLTLYAVSEKDNPTHITILEIYADSTAYKAHLQTPHFIKYKNATRDMVKSLGLTEGVPLVPRMKIK